jgi:hypothetical protein
LSTDTPNPIGDLAVDQDNLYREETFTDLKVATLQRLTPIKPDGSPDTSRETLYVGQTQLLSQAGPVPVHCPIEAASLAEAMEKFPAAIKRAVERLVEEAREIQRQEASRIVVPNAPTVGRIIKG